MERKKKVPYILFWICFVSVLNYLIRYALQLVTITCCPFCGNAQSSSIRSVLTSGKLKTACPSMRKCYTLQIAQGQVNPFFASVSLKRFDVPGYLYPAVIAKYMM